MSHMSHMSKQRLLYVLGGFTLLELMMVIAIMGILATLAIPSYQAYTSRAKFIEVIHAAAPYKLAVEICAHTHGSLEACGTPSLNGIPSDYQAPDAQTGYVATVKVSDNGKITAVSQKITIGEHSALSYILVPTLHPNGLMTWQIDTASTCLVHSVCKG